MTPIKLGILREGKMPRDRRVPFTPDQCRLLLADYPGLDLAVQASSWRAFTDDEYKAAGIRVVEDLSDRDILMGIKEVPKHELLAGKSYLFFSHTIKKQPYNRSLLQELALKKIRMVDYECLVDPQGNRIIGFGRYAGIVGAYNGIMGYGLKYNLFKLKPANNCHDKREMFAELAKVSLPNIKIVVTGSGRVANGACETLGAMGLRKVTPYEFLNFSFREPVYVQLHSSDYYVRKDGKPYSNIDFHKNPEDFRCFFSDANGFASVTDLLIHCTYWDPKADILFTLGRMREPDFRISVIADVTCDMNGSIPSTTRPTSIDEKFTGYDPATGREVESFSKEAITVMAIDNLPCELPRDASDGFGKHLIERVMPSLLQSDDKGVIARATILEGGELTERFAYLNDYLLGRE
ncbi:MAG: NAD(P)-dependent oxidoreductase [Bacteroidota bacterium]